MSNMCSGFSPIRRIKTCTRFVKSPPPFRPNASKAEIAQQMGCVLPCLASECFLLSL